MSTRSLVLVKLTPKSKKGIAPYVFNVGRIPTRVGMSDYDKKMSWYIDDETIKKNIEKHVKPIKLNDNYICIYVHWCGDTNGVGKTLLESYNNYDTALNLCLGGDCSTITDNYLPYIAWKRHGLWDENKPRMYRSKELRTKGAEYNYLFENGRWYVACSQSNYKWVKLEEFKEV